MRYLPLTPKDRADMLAAVGVKSIDDLYACVPETARHSERIKLPAHQGELEVERAVTTMAKKNLPASEVPFFLGAGCYFHHIPATVDHIIQRSEFLTSYTPYQPEISQGTLTVIFEFQTMIANLTGMDVANASMYDGATATAEAVLMAKRITKRPHIIIHGALHPEYREVVDTYIGNYPDMEIISGEPDANTSCVIVQTPDFHGAPQKLEALRKKCDETGALLVVVINEILSLGLLPAPALADIVVGEAQSIGVPMSFGGPHLGFFACRKDYLRQMPGRLCGQTVDKDGRRSFVLTLNTREQHIRREKATSNICTNQGLFALAFTIHMSLLGEIGFKQLARLNHERACMMADRLGKVKNIKILNDVFFNEFVIELPVDAKATVQKLTSSGIIAGYPLEGGKLLVCATEMTTEQDIEMLANALEKVCAASKAKEVA
ncbi:MAG: aminomethyl-transferring glycine dehydrogenase subunit GcvPA [Alphaproteobacteria bacterium]